MVSLTDMIVSKPQLTSLLSFVLFLFIASILIAINLLSILTDPHPPWFNYLIVFGLTPVAIFILYKVFFRYKIIRMGNGQIIVDHPQLRSHKAYDLKNVVSWTEAVVKTGKTSTYKELEVRFSNGKKITMAFREY